MNSRRMTCEILLVALLASILPAQSSAQVIRIDGLLDEELWDSAEQITDFTVTTPFSLSSPPRDTVVRFFSDDAGIYVGFINYQPQAEGVANTTLRDEDIQADSNEVIIDFDASGDRAFGFKLSRRDSIQDSVWSNQNSENTDWDGSWLHGVQEFEDRWTAEIFIPWDVTLSGASTAEGSVGLYFSRWHEGLRQRFSYPQISPNQQVFLRSFEGFKFQSAETSSLDFFPFLRADQDLVEGGTNYKAGIDIFWKPGNNRQVNIALNPDFGQVESNELVVNFSAIEVFFSEKRPFFRENHELFDIEGPETLRLIHTPNIGGEPDSGRQLSSRIEGAARFTQIGERFDFGILSAIETNDRDAPGRDYFASRMLYKHENGKVGLLHSLVDRPGILREAQTTSVDFEHLLGEALRFTGQFIYSHVTEELQQEQSDTGWWLTTEWQPSDDVAHTLTIFDYGEQFDVSDFGFVRRVNRRQAEYEFEKQCSELGWRGIRDAVLTFGLEKGSNAQNHALPTQIETAVEIVTDSTASWELEFEYRTDGIDDLITRGRNPVDLPATFTSTVGYSSPRSGGFSWGASLAIGREGFGEPFYEISVEPQLQLNEQINMAIEVEYVSSDSWVIHLEDNDLGDFARKELSTTLNLSAQFGERHQLSVKLESVLLEARGRQGYTALSQGALVRNGETVASFELSEFAFQARYRYELGPLSEIFLVYSRGGEFEEEGVGKGFQDTFSRSVRNPSVERLLFKIKRQF